MDTCVFCKIIAGAIPADKTYEDDQVVAFLDIHPKAPGHTLLVPREHHQWFYELPDPLYKHVFQVAKKLAPQLKEQYQAKLVKLSIVGDEVPHVHIHLIPFGEGRTPTI